jgi:hypothetical protein
MNQTITAEERDALYEQVLVHLSGIGDVWMAVEAEDYQEADRLGREFSDDLLLVLDDLGWGSNSVETITLRTAPQVLRRVLERLRRIAAEQQKLEEEERAEAERAAGRTRVVTAVCERVLAGLANEQG